MYNVRIFCEPEDVVVREVTLSQVGELQTAFIRLKIGHLIEEIGQANDENRDGTE